MKRIGELATELNVTSQAVRDKIRQLGLQDTLWHKGKAFLVDEATEEAIKQAFGNIILPESTKTAETTEQTSQSDEASQAPQDTINRLIDILQGELEARNKEIEAKNKELEAKNLQINELNARLAEALAIANSEQLLHGGTIKQLLIDTESKEAEEATEEESGVLRKLFKRFKR